MTRSKLLGTCLAASFAVGTLLAAGSAKADILLPTPNCGLGATNNCLIFDDFTVYSLALLNFKAGAGPVSPGDPFYVKSTGSDIAADVVIGSHPANATDNQDTVPLHADDAYGTPDNISSGFANFLMIPTDPTPTPLSIPGDNRIQPLTHVFNPATANATVPGASGVLATGGLPLWDIEVSALKTYLAGGHLVFFFNLNEENGGLLDSGQDMLAYLDVYLSNSGPFVGTNPLRFTLSGNDCGGGPGSCVPFAQSQAQTAGVDDILTTANDQWAYVHGEICIADGSGAPPAGTVLGFGACTAPQTAVGGQNVNQNLGANQAAFALYSKDLETALNSGLYDIMSVDLRMSHVGNGFEQLFILAGQVIGAPEPGTLAIFGAGLMYLGFRLRRRKSSKVLD